MRLRSFAIASGPTPAILEVGDSLKVTRVAAVPHLAQVIDLEIRWDRPYEHLVDEAMHILLNSPRDAKLAVSIATLVSGPEPATIRLHLNFYLAPEAHVSCPRETIHDTILRFRAVTSRTF